MAFEDMGLHGGQLGWNSGQAQLNAYNLQANSIHGLGASDYHAMIRAQQEQEIRQREHAIAAEAIQASKSNDDRLIVLLTEV